MTSPRASTDSERGDLTIEYAVTDIKLKKENEKTRVQVTYHDGYKEIVKDPCASKFGALLLSFESTGAEKAAARASLRKFSTFLLDHRIEVSHGLKCWNVMCAGRSCGITAPQGMLFQPPSDTEVYGNVRSSPEQQGHYKVHLTTPIYHEGKVTNRMKLKKELRYLIAGETYLKSQPESNPSVRRHSTCECEQCTDGGISRDLEEAIVNPLEVLSRRYSSFRVAGLGIWSPTWRALVCRDKDGTYRIRGYLTPELYSDCVCGHCKSIAKITRCGNKCLNLFSRSADGEVPDIVEPGDAAVVGMVNEFCRLRFKTLRKALGQVTERLDSFGVKQSSSVLSTVAMLVRAPRAEVVFVLNNDLSLVQPITSGSNCFLREDNRGKWDSTENLTGSELHQNIFFVDHTGTWIMIGTGERYGVSVNNAGNYHLEPGGAKMMYERLLDDKLFGYTTKKNAPDRTQCS